MATAPRLRSNGAGIRRGTIGLEPGRVCVQPYSAAWAAAFRRECLRLRRRLAGFNAQIEHIGSTAVPGLDAKPIIDIAVRLTSLRHLPEIIPRLESLGYQYKGEFGLRGRHFFTRGDPVTHHVHVVSRASKHWARWLTFRDHLRTHPEQARRYVLLKRRLAKLYASNRYAYTRAKTAFVEAILRASARGKNKKTKIQS